MAWIHPARIVIRPGAGRAVIAWNFLISVLDAASALSLADTKQAQIAEVPRLEFLSGSQGLLQTV
ncbi:MAG: hypothetical protein U0790_17185 [Isosphaeraceae bacterium]